MFRGEIRVDLEVSNGEGFRVTVGLWDSDSVDCVNSRCGTSSVKGKGMSEKVAARDRNGSVASVQDKYKVFGSSG